MKSKMLITVLAASMMILPVSGCGKKEAPAETAAIVEDEETVQEDPAQEDAAEENSEESSEVDVMEENTEESYEEDAYEEDTYTETDGNNKITWVLDDNDYDRYGFCDERAWVVNESGIYLVNTEGEAVYALENKDYEEFNSEMYGLHEFQDGVTYIEGDYQRYPVSVIIDADGNEIRRFVSGPDETFCILGYADEMFVVLDIRMNMDSYGSYIFTVGKDGEVINAPRHLDSLDEELFPDDYQFEYLGEDIFWLGHYFYNANNGSIQAVQSGGYYTPLGKFHDGKTMVRRDVNSKIYMACLEDFSEDRSNLVFKDEFPASDQCDSECVVTKGHLFDIYNNEVYDMAGKSLGWFEPYKKYDYMSIYPYEDGYTAVEIEGADGNTYITLLDPEGNALYEPVKAYQEGYEQQGYLEVSVEDGVRFVYPDGSVHSWNDNLEEMQGLNFGPVGDGFVLLYAGETNYEGWDYSNEGGYKFISLDQKQKFTFQKTDQTKKLDESDLEVTEGPEPVENDMVGEDGIVSDESSSDIMNGILNDTVLFEQDGVKLVVLDEYTVELINENPENKIVDVDFCGTYYNGINISHNGPAYATLTAQSGDTVRADIGTGYEEYRKFITDTSSKLAELPIETITYRFSIRIGTKSEAQNVVKTLQLPDYNEEDLQLLYGDKIGDFEVDGTVLTAYRLETDTGIGVVLQNNMKEDIKIPGQPRWIIGGELTDGTIRIATDYIPQGSSVIYTYDESADSVRKRMELTNDTPVEAQLDMYFDFGGDEEILIDVGELK